MTLRYFRDHALMELSDATGTHIRCDDVRWVVTVPAIWRQKAKQFMREAAYQVTILLLSFQVHWLSPSAQHRVTTVNC